MVIQRGNEFVPVKINLGDRNEAYITPTDKFSGSGDYEMKVMLNNGRKYKMTFTTVSSYRNIDIEPNDSFGLGKEMYLNETIVGELSGSQKDDKDYYKIFIPKDGSLNLEAVKLDGDRLDLYLYTKEGKTISSDTLTSKASISQGLGEGTYYIGVFKRDDYGRYELRNTFEEQDVANDNSSDNIVQADKIELNNINYGHIGYKDNYGKTNQYDYYKLDIPKDGTIKLNATQLDGGTLSLKLYGEKGDNETYIEYSNYKSKAGISKGLEKGTYYIRIDKDEGYGAYELENIFEEQRVQDDNAPSDFVRADQIGLNDTNYGHIGYTNDKRGINKNDYYKIVLSEEGSLTVAASHLDGGEISLYLYDENGTSGNRLAYQYNASKPNISKSLPAGTYYIRIENDRGYGAYELTTKFN